MPALFDSDLGRLGSRWQIVVDFAVGEIYEDCSFHTVLCTAILAQDGDTELTGISLIDGSYPRTCSVLNCGPTPLTISQAMTAKLSFETYVERRKAEVVRESSRGNPG